MQKKILFLKARTGYCDPSPPMAFSFLGRIAKEEGFKVMIENLNAPYNSKTNKDIAELIKKEKPLFVGVHMFTNVVHLIYELMDEIRPFCNLIVVGGPHASACPEETLEKGADIAVVGEAEISFRNLLKALSSNKKLKNVKGIVYKENGKIIKTGDAKIVYDLDTLPAPDKEIDRKSDYIKVKEDINNFGQMLSTRGCPGKCSYCFSLFNRCYRFLSAKKVFEEMKHLHTKYGIKFINFVDDAFTINKKRVFELCDFLIKAHLPLEWSCTTRIDFLSREMIFKMKEAGCQMIILGVETCLPRTLLGMKKIIGVNGVTSPESYVKRVDNILKWCLKANVRAGINILTGFPWETAEDMKRMQKYIDKIKHYNTQGFYGGVLQPQPGTEMYEKYAKTYGFEKWWINKKWQSLFKDSYRPFFMIYYHQYWEMLHNNFYNLDKKVFKEIDKLYKKMGKWNLYIFTKRRFKNIFTVYLFYNAFYLSSLLSMFLYNISPSLEKKLMERIKKFSYSFKFKRK